ncbi:MAG: glycosyltransferase family 2 protein [Saprospiraceae bacterium]
MSKKTFFDFVIPVYNPEQGWEKKVVDTLIQLSSNYQEVNFIPVIVNDGSTTKITDSISYISSKYPQLCYIFLAINEGKGQALRKGLRPSKSPYSLYIDADIPYEYESISRIVNAVLKNEGDVIIGKRNDSYHQNLSSFRILISKALKWFNRNILILTIDDTQAGLKAMNAYGRSIFLKTKSPRFLFDLEFVVISIKTGVRYKSVNIQIRKGIKHSTISTLSLLKELPSLLRIIRIRMLPSND